MQDIRPFEVQNYNPSVHELASYQQGYEQSEPSILRYFVVGGAILASVVALNYIKNLPDEEVTQKEHTEQIMPEVSEQNEVPEHVGFDQAMTGLLDEIARHEGGYNSVNTGKAGDTKYASPKYAALFEDRDLTDLTFAEVLQKQSGGELFAVGRYQFIPATLKSAARATGVDTKRKFDANLQNELAVNYLIMGGKRPNLAGYIDGKNIPIDKAIADLCYEFASMPGIDGTGCYDGDSAGNMAAGGQERVAVIKNILGELRDSRAEMLQNRPKITIIGDSLAVGYDKFGQITEQGEELSLNVLKVDGKVGRGLSGGRSDGLRAVNDNLAVIEQSDITVINLGTNFTESDADYKNALKATINKINSINPKTKIAFTQIHSYAKGTDESTRAMRRNEIIDGLADNYDNVYMIDMQVIADNDNNFEKDDIHLNAEGYKRATSVLLQQVEQISNT